MGSIRFHYWTAKPAMVMKYNLLPFSCSFGKQGHCDYGFSIEIKILKPATVTLWSGKYERVNIAATWATLPVIALGLSSFHIIVQTHCIPYDDPWNSSSTETVITTLAPFGLQALL